MLEESWKAVGRWEAEAWTKERELLALIVDSLQMLIAVNIKAWGGEHVDPWRVPRPGAIEAKDDAPEQITMGEFAKQLSQGL